MERALTTRSFEGIANPLLVVTVFNGKGQPIKASTRTSVTLTGTGTGEQGPQLQATALPDAEGVFVFAPVAPGDYQLSVKIADQSPVQKSVTIPTRGDPDSRVQVHHAEVPIP